jgi:hypothetical protein
MIETIKGYRTVIFNIIMTVLMFVQLWAPEADLPTGPEVTEGLIQLETALAFIWGLGNIILRAITNTPIFKKE